MKKYIALFVYFSVYLCISEAADDIFSSLEKLNLTPEQKNHISTLKSQIFYRTNQTELVKPRVEQNVINLFNVTSTNDLSAINRLLLNTIFLEICPHLVHAIDDISYSFPNRVDSYKIITEELKKPAENRSQYIEQLSFSQQETWKIFIHWILYRMAITEKYTLSTLDDFQNAQDLFMKLEAAFNGRERKENLKVIVLDLGLYSTLEKPPLPYADLQKRFPGLEKTTNDIKKYKLDNHFVHVFLPYGLKKVDEFLGLTIWLMFRIDAKEEETLKSEYPKLFEFRVKFRNELKQVEDIGQTMDITWQLANAYMNKK